MDLQDKAIGRFRRQLAALLALKYALPLATVWGFLWGTTVLVLRAAAGIEQTPLLWGSLGLVACAAAALVLARRRMPPMTAIRALLDEQSGCGGLLMAGAEQELGGWRQRMPVLKPPRLLWDGRRAGALLAIATGFVLLSFLVPQGLADLRFSSPLEIDREIARLLKQIALLKSESILEAKRAETLAEKASELLDHSSGKEPSRTLEALDHLRNLTREAARQSAEQSAQRSQHLNEAQTMAEALLQNADLIDPQLMKEVLAELDGLTDKDGLPPELKEALRQRKLDPEQLKKMSGLLRSRMGDLMRRMEGLHAAGLIDAEALALCRCTGECDLEALRAFLRDNKSNACLADFKSLCKGGGISRGPGAAPMTWGNPSSEEGFKFKEVVLPPGALDALRSTPIQESRGQGVIHKKSSETASSGALQGATAGSGSSNTQVILPRHRAAVERYFERPNLTSPQRQQGKK